jgi:hypothetical protein
MSRNLIETFLWFLYGDSERESRDRNVQHFVKPNVH